MGGSRRWRRIVESQGLGNLLLAVTLLGIFSLHAGIGDLHDAYDEQTRVFLATAGVQPMSTTFTDLGGDTHTVSTPRLTPDERYADVLDRHAADLAAAKAMYP